MVEATPGLQAILGRPLSELAKITSQPLTATIPHILTGTKVYERDVKGYQDKKWGEMMNRVTRKYDKLKYELERSMPK